MHGACAAQACVARCEPAEGLRETPGGACMRAQVKLLKDAEKRGAAQAKPRRPRALVLGPTRELTDQILGVAKSMSHHAKFRSACVNGGAPACACATAHACSMSSSCCLMSTMVRMHARWTAPACSTVKQEPPKSSHHTCRLSTRQHMESKTDE
jgi:hypothetical protein